MQDLMNLLRDLVETQINRDMSNEDFYTYLEQHPSLHSVISSAMREGDVSTGILDVNFPKSIDVHQKDALALLNQLSILALWLVTAGKKHGFSVLGVVGEITTTIPRHEPRTSRHRKRNVPGEELPPQQKNLKKLCDKAGGVTKTKKIIQGLYDKTNSQRQTAKQLKKMYTMDIKQGDVSRWMRALNLRVNLQVGGHKVTLKKNIRKADQALREKKGIGLVAFIRRERADHLTKAAISRKIKKITGITVASGSMSHLTKRLHIR